MCIGIVLKNFWEAQAGEEVSPQEALYEDIFWEGIDSCGGFYGNDVTENGMADYWPEMEEVA